MITISILAILIGYLLGSISPAYFLGWALKKVDIRTVGTKNAGTTNVYKTLGIGPAVITAIFDLGKGLLAMYIAHLLHANELAIYLAGFMAIIGHIYPFYLKFRGGQGMATALGLTAYLFIIIFSGQNFYNSAHLVESVVVMLVYVLSILFITKRGEVVGIFSVPVFTALLFLNYKIDIPTVTLGLILVVIFIVQLYNTIDRKIIPVEKFSDQLLHWRTLARPLAVVFPILSLYIPENIFLYITGIIAGVFVLIDLVRLLSSKINLFFFDKIKFLFKTKEQKHFSSMTLFLAAIFITFLVFPQNIAIPASLFVIFGDLAGKFFGLLYPQKKFLDKGLEGSLAYFVFSLLPAFIFSLFVPIPFWIIIAGALTAAITEAVSIFGIDDNFTVALVSGAVMFAFIKLV